MRKHCGAMLDGLCMDQCMWHTVEWGHVLAVVDSEDGQVVPLGDVDGHVSRQSPLCRRQQWSVTMLFPISLGLTYICSPVVLLASWDSQVIESVQSSVVVLDDASYVVVPRISCGRFQYNTHDLYFWIRLSFNLHNNHHSWFIWRSCCTVDWIIMISS